MRIKQTKFIAICLLSTIVLAASTNITYSQDKANQEPFKLNANIDVTTPTTKWRLISKPTNPGNYENYYKRPLKHYDLINKNSNGVVNLPETPSFAAQAKKDSEGITFKQYNPVNNCGSCTPMSFNYYQEYTRFNNFMPIPSMTIQKSGFGASVSCPGF